jgi:putative (di)nucleoside polyphosphate hydrolase
MIVGDEIFDDTRYRANVGIMIVNPSRQVLAGEARHYRGEWIMPQGGIDGSETPFEAMQRELYEETTLEFVNTKLLMEHAEWIGYRTRNLIQKEGKTYIGQRQKWFLLEYEGPLPDAEHASDREFLRFDWVDPPWLVDNTARFKQEIYRRLFSDFGIPYVDGNA